MAKGIVLKDSSGVFITNSKFTGLDTAIEAENTSSIHIVDTVISKGFDPIYAAFPLLQNAPDDLLVSYLKSTEPDAVNEETLKSSRLGEWLQSQRFVEWAGLATAVAALFVS